MKKVNLDTLIPKIYQLENTSMLGVGPMSTNVIQACFELAKDNNFELYLCSLFLIFVTRTPHSLSIIILVDNGTPRYFT